MKTIFPVKRPLLGAQRAFLGQALSAAEREHYLTAVTRAIQEAREIDEWLGENPGARLAPPPVTVAEGVAPSPIVISPYYTQWFNYQEIRPAMTAFFERLANPDPATWSSVLESEHDAFGWVSVVDKIYAAWKADPKNLTAGIWLDGIRLPDAPGTPEAIPAQLPISVLGLELPPRFLGMPTGAVIVVGGLGAVLIGIALYSTRDRK